MHGSGIYSYTIDLCFTCEAELDDEQFCDFEGDVTAVVDDWSEVSVECPKCNNTRNLGKERELHL